jgi:hypothetical protein
MGRCSCRCWEFVVDVSQPFDKRGSFDALAGAVRRLGMDPINGLYLFLNKRCRLAKALCANLL